MRWWAGLGVALWGLGCASAGTGGTASSSSASSSSGGGSGSAASSGGAPFTMGTAAWGMTHEDVPDGATVDVVTGPQGGYHIYLSVGLTSRPSQDQPRLAYEVKDDSATYAQGMTTISPHPEGDAWVDVGAYMFFDWSADPTGWSNHPVDVTVRLLDDQEQEQGRVARRWNATCCLGGLGGGPGGGDGGVRDGEGDGGVVGGNGPVTCEAFCARVMDGCAATDASLPFASSEACLTECATWPYGSFSAAPGGNTLVCRDHYAQRAETHPGECVRLEENWASLCVDR